MAKLTRLLNKNIKLREQNKACREAYGELLIKYRKLYTKYSYEETREHVKEIDKDIKIDGKILWDNLKEENLIKAN